MNKLKAMKKLGVLIVLAGVFLCGARQKLIRDPQGIKGHTDTVKWEISKGTDAIYKDDYILKIHKDDYILKIPIEYETNFSDFDLEKWKNKLPPARGVSPDKDGSYPVDPAIITFLTKPDPRSFLLMTLSCHPDKRISAGRGIFCPNGINVSLLWEENIFMIVMPEKQKWQAKEDITLYLGDAFKEIGIHIINSPIKIHFSCSRKGCLVTDENEQIVNKIKITGEIVVNEKELTEAKQAIIQENKEMIEKEKAAKAAAIAAEKKRKAQIERDGGTWSLNECLEAEYVVKKQRIRIQYPKDFYENRLDRLNTRICQRQLKEYYQEINRRKEEAEQERLRELGY